jgi:hypothetical protein
MSLHCRKIQYKKTRQISVSKLLDIRADIFAITWPFKKYLKNKERKA